jgi:Tfp pilus assembly protein PilE
VTHVFKSLFRHFSQGVLMNRSIQKGFPDRIEIVVAILVALAAVALLAYQDYTIRAKVSEGLVLVDETAITETHQARGPVTKLYRIMLPLRETLGTTPMDAAAAMAAANRNVASVTESVTQLA